MKDVTKGPGDLYDPEDYEPNMDGFEEWLESVDDNPSRKLELLEEFITYKRTATGTILSSLESPYGTIATVACPLDEAFESWLAEKYVSEYQDDGGW